MPHKVFALALLLLGITQIALSQEPFAWHFGEEDGLPSMTTYRIIQDQKGFIWIATENGLCRYDGKEIKVYENPKLIDNEILDLREDKFGRIWVKNLVGQLGYVENDSIHVLDLSQEELAYEFTINGDYLWILSKLNDFGENGKRRDLFCYQLNKDIAVTNHVKMKRTLSLRSNVENYGNNILIRALRPDTVAVFQFERIGNEIKEEKLFDFHYNIFSINPPGLIKVLNKNQMLLNRPNSSLLVKENAEWKIDYKKFNVDEIKDVILVNGQEWAMMSNGIVQFERVKSHSSLNESRLFSKSEITMNSFFLDKEKNLWVATEGKGVMVIYGLENLVYNKSNFGLSNNEIYNIHPIEDGLLIGMNKGKVNVLRSSEIEEIKLGSQENINSFYKDDLGRYWISSGENTKVLNGEMKVIQNIKGGYKCIGQDVNQDYLIGFSSSCFKVKNIFFNPDLLREIEEIRANFIIFPRKHFYQNKIRELNIKDTIYQNKAFFRNEMKIVNRTYSVFKSQSNITWLGTSEGLYFIDKKGEVIPFIENGIQNSYSVSSITESKDSIIWVATLSDGLLGIKNNSVIHRLIV